MNIKVVLLYDVYKNLLNESERISFESYYFENLSLGEISENLNISRNAIHKKLKKISDKLLDYESKLKLLYKLEKIKKLEFSYKEKILDILE